MTTNDDDDEVKFLFKNTHIHSEFMKFSFLLRLLRWVLMKLKFVWQHRKQIIVFS